MPITHKINGKEVHLHKSTCKPSWGEPTVLVESTWDYVALWLAREKQKRALFFWEQSRSFYEATKSLPKTSAPLTSYYCFLNAVKCLLTVKKIPFDERHGVSGWTKKGSAGLAREFVKFKNKGILPELCRYLGENVNNNVYSAKDILYNLAYIHRAYHLTFTSQPELFIPISKGKYVHAPASKKSWFSAVIDANYAHSQTVAILPPTFERDKGDATCFVARRKKRFDWIRGKAHKNANLTRLSDYHRDTRKYLHYIYAPMRLWYLKRKGAGVKGYIDRHPMALTFSLMHRLSELARYSPEYLSRHFDSQHNWLLSEFIQVAPSQFIDEISAEITGQEFMIPGRAAR